MGQPVPLLLYHSVGEGHDPRFADWGVSPERFAAQMDHLAENGYRTVTMRELAERVFEHGEPLAPRTVAITFDDGFEDFHTVARPELSGRSLTATVFVTTGYVGGTSEWLARQGEERRPMMSWSQIEEVASAGIEVGAHGHTHAQLDTVSAAMARREIEGSRDALEQVVGPVASFAYPHGYSTRRVRRQVAEAGFTSACAVGDTLGTIDRDRYALARLIVRGSTTIEEFARLVSGEGPAAEPRARPLRRGAWRTVRRAGGEPLVDWLRGPPHRTVRGGPT